MPFSASRVLSSLDRVLTNSKCLSDEIYIRDCDQKDQKKRDIGYDCYSAKGLLYHSVSKEEKMRKRNLTPILMLWAGSTISGEHLVDQWHETEETAGSRLEAWDDLTGLSLDPKGVLAARKQGLKYISQKQVWEIVPREEARRNGWKVIKSRWIDINRGDDVASLYRSRLVGKEFADKKVEGLFAGTLRFLVHEAATVEGKEEEQEKVIIVNDVARAFFEAKAIRKLCVELPSERPESFGGYNVGLLKQSLYGTRDAAMNWQEEVAKEMKGWGFDRGQFNQCLCTKAARRVQVFLQGDDFASVGKRVALKWFRQQFESRFEIKTSVIGTGIGGVREARVLNRILRITDRCW